VVYPFHPVPWNQLLTKDWTPFEFHFPNDGLFEALHLQGQLHLLPLRLVSRLRIESDCYLCGCKAGFRARFTWTGFSAARLRDIAKPLLMDDPSACCRRVTVLSRHYAPTQSN
jgi:hypothetical protein